MKVLSALGALTLALTASVSGAPASTSELAVRADSTTTTAQGVCIPGKYACGARDDGSEVGRWIFVCTGDGKWAVSADCGGAGCCTLAGNTFVYDNGLEGDRAFCTCRDEEASKTVRNIGSTANDIDARQVGVCTPSKYSCGAEGTQVLLCDSSGSWTLSTACHDAFVCALEGVTFQDAKGVDEANHASCKAPKSPSLETANIATVEGSITTREVTDNTCISGKYTCAGKRIFVCSAQMEWVLSSVCAADCCSLSGTVTIDSHGISEADRAFCNCRAEQSSGSAIEEPMAKRETINDGCVPAKYTCNGAGIFVCTSLSTWTFSSACGTKYCILEGNLLTDSRGNPEADRAFCVNKKEDAALASTTPARDLETPEARGTDYCTPGTTECGGNVIFTCNSQGIWIAITFCGGPGGAPSCCRIINSQAYCVCRDEDAPAKTIEARAKPSADQVQACTPGQTVCHSAPYVGAWIDTCNVQRVWQVISFCGTRQDCCRDINGSPYCVC